MKITTNSFGNYSPGFVNKTQQTPAAASQPNDADKISKEEKKFFANLYPEKKSEIMDYQFYNSKGKVSGVTIGSLFDRRG